MINIRVAVVDSFWESFCNLPKKQQKKTREFLTKFRQAPNSSAINYEKLNQACQKNYRSVRIDQTYRAIIMVPEKGNTYVLLWVDHHDDCIQWSARTKCSVHPSTGTLQIYKTVTENNPLSPVTVNTELTPTLGKFEVHRPASLPSPIFNLDDTRLSGIGCPDAMLSAVKDLRSRSELESIKAQLPVETFDALMLFHEGMDWGDIWAEYHISPNEIVDTEDVDAALRRITSRRRFKVLESEHELREMLNAPLEKWRVFLHPSQRRLVEWDVNGPIRVLGGAGTGKTVVAMHRVAWLIRRQTTVNHNKDYSKVLFLTYNTNLVEDIKQNLAKILTSEELEKVEVINIDTWVVRFLKAKNYIEKIVNEAEMSPLWDSLLHSIKPTEPYLPNSFYKEEWMRVILPNRIESSKDYLGVSRQGRGVALNRKQRALIWPVFSELRSKMKSKGLRTYQDATLDAVKLLQEIDNSTTYSHVVVDETQDMGSEALSLIRSLVPRDKNDLFLVGDGHQRIYRSRAVMSRCGINIKGRGKKLKINYRTTEEIRQFSMALLQGLTVDDLDDGVESGHQYISLTNGDTPNFDGFETIQSEANFIAEQVKKFCLTELSTLGDCCVVLRTVKLRDEFAELLRTNGLDVVTLGTRANNPNEHGIRLASMHRVKGLEFRHVFLAAINKQTVPNFYATHGTEDHTEIRDRDFNERALIHVAASRAIESLNVTWHGDPSAYLENFATNQSLS